MVVVVGIVVRFYCRVRGVGVIAVVLEMLRGLGGNGSELGAAWRKFRCGVPVKVKEGQTCTHGG